MTRRSLFGFLRGLMGMFDHLLLWNFRGADADSFRWRPWQGASQRRMLRSRMPRDALDIRCTARPESAKARPGSIVPTHQCDRRMKVDGLVHLYTCPRSGVPGVVFLLRLA